MMFLALEKRPPLATSMLLVNPRTSWEPIPEQSVPSGKLAILDGVRDSWDAMNDATGMEKLVRPTFTFLPCL